MKSRELIWEILSLLIAGAGIGWMVGLSVSHNSQTIITTFLGIIATLIAGLSGLRVSSGGAQKPEDQTTLFGKSKIRRVTAVPLGLVVFGMVVGTSLGVLCRENNLLGFQPGLFYARFSSLPSGEQQGLLKKIFEEKGDLKKIIDGGHLDAVSVNDCAMIRLKTGGDLLAGLRLINDPNVNRALTLCKSNNDYLIVKTLLCPD
jgi:hypothetical protein